MVFKAEYGKIGLIVAACVLLAGCNKISSSGATTPSSEPRISESELRAYCPRVVLPETDAFYTVYERGGEENASRIVYQVVIDKVTRACRYGAGQITMEVAAAGRVVPGAKFNGTNPDLPIYVRVKRGEEVLYNQAQSLKPSALSRGQATQFLFKDTEVQFEQPSARNVLVFVGFNRPR